MFSEGLDGRRARARTATSASINVLESPLGCYDERRFDSREEMVAQIMSVFGKDPARVAA